MSDYGRGRYTFGVEFYPEVDTFADLPAAAANVGIINIVKTGSWSGIWYYRPGLYRSDGSSWTRLAPLNIVSDEIFTLYDDATNTKKAMFECSTIGAATTRTFTFPDASGTLALQSWVSAGYQPLDAELTALAGLASAADKLPYFTGSGTASLATFTAYARSILDDADESTFKQTVNLEIGVDVQAYGAVLDDLDTLGVAASDGQFIVATGAGAFAYESGATARSSIGLGTSDTFTMNRLLAGGVA